jgi:hypothetical protein
MINNNYYREINCMYKEPKEKEQRRQNETVYYEAFKWIIRGILFNAPMSIREKYKSVIAPLGLGGYGIPDNKMDSISAEEIALLDKFINHIQSLPIPTNPTQEEAEKYVKQVVSLAQDYIEDFQYFQEELKTITGNVANRDVLIKLATLTIPSAPSISPNMTNQSSETAWLKDKKGEDEVVQALKNLSSISSGTNLEDIKLESNPEDLENWYQEDEGVQEKKGEQKNQDKDSSSDDDEKKLKV